MKLPPRHVVMQRVELLGRDENFIYSVHGFQFRLFEKCLKRWNGSGWVVFIANIDVDTSGVEEDGAGVDRALDKTVEEINNLPHNKWE